MMQAASTSTPSDESFDLSKVLRDIAHFLPDQAPLKDFIHHNPLHAFADEPFHAAVKNAGALFGARCHMPRQYYQESYAEGKITDAGIDAVLAERFASEGERQSQRGAMLAYLKADAQHDVDHRARLRSHWRGCAGIDLDALVQPLLFKLLGNYLDQGIAIWRMPAASKPFWYCVGSIAAESFLPLAPLTDPACLKILAMEPDAAIHHCLAAIVGEPSLYQTYLTEMLLSHPGWSGMAKITAQNPQFLTRQRLISLRDLVAVELVFEYGWLQRRLGAEFHPLKVYLTANDTNTNTSTSGGPSDSDTADLWQDALEWSYYGDVLEALAQRPKNLARPPQPKFQAFFCLDDRECSLRRHLEEVMPAVETFGTPGFFGIEFFFKAAGNRHLEKFCPAPVHPKHLVIETAPDGQDDQDQYGLTSIFSGRSNTLVRGWVSTHLLGFLSLLFLLKNLLPGRHRSHKKSTTVLGLHRGKGSEMQDGLYVGFTFDEMATRVAQTLRSTALVDGFADTIFLVAHGASSANNPHFAAYDCGACSGKPGSPNARAFAWMANHREVRQRLRAMSIDIPERTVFVAALHNTTTDQVIYFDEEGLTAGQSAQVAEFMMAMSSALKQNAHERCRRFELVSAKITPTSAAREVRYRATAFFEPRPELNHATNVACIVGRRQISRGLDLDRRAFLQSYDPNSDADGSILAGILSAVVPVCGGINLEYYFSKLDNEVYGAGSKLPHNVMGLIGVANGVDGDLRTGLPWQMVEVHDPLRLLIVVEQTPEIALQAIRSNAEIYKWISNGWVHLVASHPVTAENFRFKDGAFVKLPVSGVALPVCGSSVVVYQGKRGNIRVHKIEAGKDA